MSTEDSLARLADSTERIAGALEQLARAQVARPLPDVLIARAPSDVSTYPVATIHTDGKLMFTMQNVGAARCTLKAPTLRAGQIVQLGGIIGRDHQPHDSGELPAAPSGPGLTVVFELGSGFGMLVDEELIIEVPYEGGPYPGVSVRQFVLEPQGTSNGRYGFTARADNVRPG